MQTLKHTVKVEFASSWHHVCQCCTCLPHTSSWDHSPGTPTPDSQRKQSQELSLWQGGTGLREVWIGIAKVPFPKGHGDHSVWYGTVLGYFHCPCPKETSSRFGNKGLLILHKNTSLLIMQLLFYFFFFFWGEKKQLIPSFPLRMGRM